MKMFANLTETDLATARKNVGVFAEKISVAAGNETRRAIVHNLMSLLRNYAEEKPEAVTYATFAEIADRFTGRNLRKEFPRYADVCTMVSKGLMK